jgi:hypothetical protein
MTDWVVTANLSGPKGTAPVKEAVHAWGREALARRPAIVFVQELPSDGWLAPWCAEGYRLAVGSHRGWQVRSAVLTRPDLTVDQMTAQDLPNLRYHGEYVATARWESARGPVVLASVHASPNPAEPERYGWPGVPPEPRDGGGDPRHAPKRLWDSDLLLESLVALAEAGDRPLLAGGDLNEALDYDLDPSGTRIGTWGQEYFERMRSNGLVPWLTDALGGEIPTRGRWQLDHLLLSRAADGLLATEPIPYLDATWQAADESARSDHAPVWAAIDFSWLG